MLEADDSATPLTLDESLTKLAQVDPKLAKLVELRYFSGLTILLARRFYWPDDHETSEILGIFPRATKRNWSRCSRMHEHG